MKYPASALSTRTPARASCVSTSYSCEQMQTSNTHENFTNSETVIMNSKFNNLLLAFIKWPKRMRAYETMRMQILE